MTATYTFPLWLPVVLALVSIGLVMSGVFVKRRNERRKKFNILHYGFWAIGAVGMVFTLAIGSDSVVLDGTKLEEDGWISMRKTIPLQALESIAISHEEELGKRGTRVVEIWTASYSDRPPIRVRVGDLWETNGADIVAKLRARGVAVTDSR